MENTWTLEVTQDHIDNAISYHPNKWAIALALRDKGAKGVDVNTTSIEFYSMDSSQVYMFYKTDKAIDDWQWDAMHEDICKPITIEFDDDNSVASIVVLQRIKNEL